jgi:hypothetical protein
MPRAFFAGRIIEADSAARSLDVMRDPEYNPRKDVVVERPAQKRSDEGVTPRSPHEFSMLSLDHSTKSQQGAATIVEDRRNRVVIETESESEGLLVLSDNYYPGWRAFIDGAETEILRANHTMRAVKVSAGRHVVSFVFAPPAFWVSAYLSLVSAALVVITLGFSLIRRKRKPSREGHGHDLQQDKKDN